jgi:hypothetical protein
MTHTDGKARAVGTFDVTLTPQPQAPDEAQVLGRRALAKTFHGDLEGTAFGVMISIGSPATGSAAYSALERVEGTLHGRRGGFALQHTGEMDRGAPSLAIRVVPDSGTGELEGLRGEFSLRIADGVHHYELAYSLPVSNA